MFEPISEMGVLGLQRRITLGAEGEPYGSTTASRSVAVYERDGYFVVADKHRAAAGPPRASETAVLKEALSDRGLL